MRVTWFIVLLAPSAFAETTAKGPVDGGAEVAVQVNPSGETTVDVKRGEVQVKAGNHVARVRSGESIRAGRDRVVHRLLPAPKLRAPANDATLNLVEVGFGWVAVRDARGYHLEVANDALFSTALRQSDVPGLTTALHLDGGSYFWRVTPYDAAGMRGRPSIVRHFVIDTTPPKIKAGKPEWR
jgi:hypothetical protein